MNIGMLWYDDDKHRPLAEKVQRAAAFYQAKYGRAPTVCHVNPKMVTGGATVVAGVKLRVDRTVLVDHFWIGVETVVGECSDA